ncbi:MAG: helix-turn-helix domain-containing protein [Patescibacteria group bacterium]
MFQEKLKEHIDAKNISHEKLAELSGVSLRHIEAILIGESRKLPPAPYIRGYLLKMANVLNANGDELWSIYEREMKESLIQTSGAADRLPHNRFALKRLNSSVIIGTLIAIVVLAYGAANVDRFLGKPSLVIQNPGSETLVTTANVILITGSIDPKDALVIDGEPQTTDTKGNFSKSYNLDEGLNRITFTARRLLGRETTITRQIIYQP